VAAVLLYFRADLWRVAVTWLRSLRDPALRKTLDARMGWYLIIATIPISVFGLAFSDTIETGARDLYLIGVMLIVVGLVMAYADRTSKRTREMEDVTAKDGIAIGFAQAVALIPGTSRSGATITAGLFLGMTREAAARFSFLLSVPAVVLSGLYEGSKIARGTEHADASTSALIIATVFAFIFGYLSIAFLLRFLATNSLNVFVLYRIVLGVLVIALAAAGVIS
jgi:undecaprenyl-diphosphatase